MGPFIPNLLSYRVCDEPLGRAPVGSAHARSGAVSMVASSNETAAGRSKHLQSLGRAYPAAEATEGV